MCEHARVILFKQYMSADGRPFSPLLRKPRLDWHLPVGHLVMPPLFNDLTVGNPCFSRHTRTQQHGLVTGR